MGLVVTIATKRCEFVGEVNGDVAVKVMDLITIVYSHSLEMDLNFLMVFSEKIESQLR